MGACGLAAVVVLLLASALLPAPASASGRRVLEGENPNSGEAAPSPKDDASKESGHASAAGQQAENKRHQKQLTPASSPPKDTKEGGEAKASASPPPTQETNPQKSSPPPGGLGPNGGTDREETGSQVKKEETDKLKETMEKCDASHKCSAEEKFSACLVSDNASVGPYIIVQNKGQDDIDVHVKEPLLISNDKNPPHLLKGAFGQIHIKYIPSDGGNITLSDGKLLDCIIHVGQLVERHSVSDWQEQFQQIVDSAMRLNPIFGASFFVFTVILVGVICACCKFAKRRGNAEVPYQQLEMGGHVLNSSGMDNTASTTDGWEDGWDDDWDDDEAPARPADKKPTSSVSGNGHSLTSQTNSKDGWDVDWDD